METSNKDLLDSELQRDHFQRQDEDDASAYDNNDNILIDSEPTPSTDNNSLASSQASNDGVDLEMMLVHTNDNDNNNDNNDDSEDNVPKELHSSLDGDYWSRVGFTMSDTILDLAVNLDKFYWRDDDDELREEVSTVLSVVVQWTSIKPSYVFAAMYQVKPTIKVNEQHASKATPQYLYY